MSLLAHFAHISNEPHTHVTISEGAAAVLVLSLLFFVVVTYVVTSIMLARIFKKAGVASRKAWVPIYSTWATLELGEQKGWWAILFLFPLINLVAIVYLYIAMYRIGLRFGKDEYFVLWAIFLPIAWYAWLAFDHSTWRTITTADTAKNHPQA